jgi:hypothetical protein
MTNLEQPLYGEWIEKIIIVLENVRSRRPLWILNSTEPDAVMNWIYGFNCACGVFGLKSDEYQLSEQIAIDRGWKWNALGAIPSMRERGLSGDEIGDELLCIEIEFWKRVGQQYRSEHISGR